MTGTASNEDARTPAPGETVAWHDVECGAYSADLDAWEGLVRRTGGGHVLELGCGTGRVALHLAARGHAVSAIEIDEELAAEASRRADSRRLAVQVTVADALDGPRADFGAALAPMQLVQTIPAGDRGRLLAAMRAGLRHGGLAALAFVDDESLAELDVAVEEPPPALPDVQELEGWVYSSRPLWVSVDEKAITVTRVREVVAPDGQLFRGAHRDVLARLSASVLEREAAEHGLSPLERIRIPGVAEVDSTIVVLEAG